MQDFIVGPHDETIKTKNFPVLSSIIGLWYEGDTPFQAEVFFINLAKVIQIKFGVPYFDVVDPRFPDFAAPVAVRGTLTFQIEDYKQFIKCHQLINFDLETLKTQVTDAINQIVKDCVTNAPAANNIPLIQIETNRHVSGIRGLQGAVCIPAQEGIPFPQGWCRNRCTLFHLQLFWFRSVIIFQL